MAPAWSKTHDYGTPPARDLATGIAVDGENNLLVAGIARDNEWSLTKYDPSGNPLGVVGGASNIPGPAFAPVSSVGVDGDNGFIVVGGRPDGNWRMDKYDSTLNHVWHRTHREGLNAESAYDVAVQDNGSFVAVGYSSNNSGEWMIRKYDRDGNLLWDATHNGTGSSNDSAHAVALDSGNNVIVAGYEFALTPSVNTHKWTVRKYNSSGGLLWSRTAT